MVTRPDPLEVDTWLCWAGKCLLAMPSARVKPQEYRSYWPDVVQELNKFERLNHGERRKQPSGPTKDDIPIMDQILLLPNLCEDVEIRRVLRLRSLIHPLRDNHVYSWTRIAKVLHSDRRAVARLYDKGLEETADKIDYMSVRKITNYFSSGSAK